MAEQIQDKLYRVSIGGRWNYSFIHAEDEKDLIKYLAANYPNKDDIYEAQEITPDGTQRPIKLLSNPLFEKLYAQIEDMGATQKLPAGVTMIDGKHWAVMLPTGGWKPDDPCHWNDLMTVTHSDDNLVHWKSIASWCQESTLGHPFHLLRGYTSADKWHSVGFTERRADYVGYRPVLMPLDPETFEPRPSYFFGRQDGDVFRMGTLYMDGLPLPNPEVPTRDGDIMNYKPSSMLHIGNSSRKLDERISWIKVGDVLIADRNLIKNISWDDLDRMGLAQGPKHLQYLQKEKPLDRVLDEAQHRAATEKVPPKSKDLTLTK